MKHIQTLLLISAAALLAACDGSENIPAHNTGSLTPISARAIMPGADGSGSITPDTRGTATPATRAFGDATLTNLTLYFPTAKTGADAIASLPIAAANITHTSGQDNFSFNTTGTTTGSGTGATTTGALYWESLPGKGTTPTTFYLTLDSKEYVLKADNTPTTISLENTLWTTQAVAAKPDVENPAPADTPDKLKSFAFTTPMKSRWARLTLRIEVATTDPRFTPSLMAAQLYAVPAATSAIATAAPAIATQAWPVKSGEAAASVLLPLVADTDKDATTKRIAGGTLIAPQDLPEGKKLLYLAYNTSSLPDGTSTGITIDSSEPSATWVLDLSRVSVTRVPGSPHAALGTTFGYNAAEHITLTLRISLLPLLPGTGGSMLTVTDYTAQTIDGNFDTGAPEVRP